MHSLNKLWLLVLVFTCGCCTSKIVGYLDNRSDKIQSEKPVIAVPADHFTILRNEFTNSYDIRINEKQYFYARNSVDNEAYEILLIATTGTLPWNAPVRLVCPALYSTNIFVDTIWYTPGKPQLFIRVTTNELGKDFLLASLCSPAGIRGIFQFGDRTHFIPFEAHLIERNSLVSAVYYDKTIWGKRLRLKSLVEYPLRLAVHYRCPDSEKAGTRSITLRSWKEVRIRIPRRLQFSQIGSAIDIGKEFPTSSPFTFKPYFDFLH